MGALWRRRAYVPRPALRLHAGEMFCAAFPAESRSVAGARLQTGLADVADPETAGRFARGAEDDLDPVRRVGKGASRRAHHPSRIVALNGGHASLCPPYKPSL